MGMCNNDMYGNGGYGDFSYDDMDETPIKTVTIPACESHNGMDSITIRLRWICPTCGTVRGKIKKTKSYDGSRQLSCDGWENTCRHIDEYSRVRGEAKHNGLNV